MPDLNYKVVIDTNWLISYVIKKQQSNFHSIFINEKILFYSSIEQINEFKEKVIEEKFRKYFTLPDAVKFIKAYIDKAIFINVVSVSFMCRDPKDNYLLSLSKDSNADYLITGDKDLLVLKKFEHTSIITLSQFIEIINQNL